MSFISRFCTWQTPREVNKHFLPNSDSFSFSSKEIMRYSFEIHSLQQTFERLQMRSAYMFCSSNIHKTDAYVMKYRIIYVGDFPFISVSPNVCRCLVVSLNFLSANEIKTPPTGLDPHYAVLQRHGILLGVGQLICYSRSVIRICNYNVSSSIIYLYF